MIAEFPEIFQCLFEPHRYKVLKGGRGGMKSYSVADALLIDGVRQFERILCARENMNSLAESVHHLLETRIHALGLQGHYQILKSTILGPDWGEDGRTEFIFAGLRHNVANIKSLEGVTKLWVEEAQSVSKASWDTVIPTIRWECKRTGRKSEIWVTFNPDLTTDDTYKRFVLANPPDTVLIHTDYRDNSWLPDVLRIEAEYLKDNNPDDYDHIWLGNCISALKGAIYSAEIKAAEAQGRITSVPYDRTRPVDTFWDLGFGDLTSIWFVQSLPSGQFRLIDYLENRGKTIADYVVALQHKGYVYGTDWVPHDATDTIIHAKLAGSGNRDKSIEMLLRAAGRKVRIAPKMHVVTGINAARTIFPQCWFDETKCADGLQSLRHYQMGEPSGATPDVIVRKSGVVLSADGIEKREPLHNWASHGSDAFRTMAVTIKQPAVDRERQQHRQRAENSEHSWMA